MKTLEEKRKDIEALCENLDTTKIKRIYPEIICKSVLRLICDDKRVQVNLSDDEDYEAAIHMLNSLPKEPDLYTWQEIDRVAKKWIEERHTIKEHTSVFDFLKNNIKPYKK